MFDDISSPSLDFTAGGVLARMVEGIGFRLRWAVDGLRAEDVDFTPSSECMTIRGLVEHIFGMMAWVDSVIDGPPREDPPSEFEALCEATLERLRSLREKFAQMSEDDLKQVRLRRANGNKYPLWNAINGPLADSLTHVGQINMWRRLNGNPVKRVNWFEGKA